MKKRKRKKTNSALAISIVYKHRRCHRANLLVSDLIMTSLTYCLPNCPSVRSVLRHNLVYIGRSISHWFLIAHFSLSTSPSSTTSPLRRCRYVVSISATLHFHNELQLFSTHFTFHRFLSSIFVSLCLRISLTLSLSLHLSLTLSPFSQIYLFTHILRLRWLTISIITKTVNLQKTTKEQAYNKDDTKTKQQQ